MARDRDSEVANLRLKSNELAQSCVWKAASVPANGFQSSGSNGTFWSLRSNQITLVKGHWSNSLEPLAALLLSNNQSLCFASWCWPFQRDRVTKALERRTIYFYKFWNPTVLQTDYFACPANFQQELPGVSLHFLTTVFSKTFFSFFLFQEAFITVSVWKNNSWTRFLLKNY